jgi:sRNA-binding carbon storage regulator CsrA
MEERGNLVVSCKYGHSIQVGESTITVLRRTSNGVRLSIAAPKDIEIIRDDAGLKTRGGEE